jgi:hypothetical protein
LLYSKDRVLTVKLYDRNMCPRVLYFFPPIKHTITKINDNINMDCTIAWSVKVLILKLYLLSQIPVTFKQI